MPTPEIEMSKTQDTGTFRAALPVSDDVGTISSCAQDRHPKGLIERDGRIAATASDLLESLGFSPDDDLRGLPFTSFWHHPERPAAQDALRRARAGEETRIDVDLSYIHDSAGQCTIALSPDGSTGKVAIHLGAAL